MLTSANLNVKNFFQNKRRSQDRKNLQSKHHTNLGNTRFQYLGTDKCSLSNYMKFMSTSGWTLSLNTKSAIVLTSNLDKLNFSSPEAKKIALCSLKVFGQNVNQSNCTMRAAYSPKTKKTTYIYCHQFQKSARGFELKFDFIKDKLPSSNQNPTLKRFPLPPRVNLQKEAELDYNGKTKSISLIFFK